MMTATGFDGAEVSIDGEAVIEGGVEVRRSSLEAMAWLRIAAGRPRC